MKALLVQAILGYLRFFARIALQFNKPTVIGITGSVGKSSARNAVSAILQDNVKFRVIRKGNSETGIPLGILDLEPQSLGFQTVGKSIVDWGRMLLSAPLKTNNLSGIDYLLVEMGVDEPDPPKNMGYLLSIVKPDIAVFLNVHPVHTLQFDKTVDSRLTPEQRLVAIQRRIAEEKGRIITESGCKTAVYNADNQYVNEVVSAFAKNHTGTEYLSFGKDSGNSIQLLSHSVETGKTMFSFSFKGDGELHLEMNGSLLPAEYAEIFAAAMLVAKTVGIEPIKMKTGLEKNFHLPAGRMTPLQGVHDSLIIDSSYNASKASVLAALSLASGVAKPAKRPLVFLFGDMRELGEEAGPEHEYVAEQISTAVDMLYCVGPNTFKYVVPKLEKRLKECKWFHTSQAAGEYLKDHLPQNAVLLVKGSQNQIFLEEAVKMLLKDPADAAKLCRQDAHWMEMKQKTVTSS